MERNRNTGVVMKNAMMKNAMMILTVTVFTFCLGCLDYDLVSVEDVGDEHDLDQVDPSDDDPDIGEPHAVPNGDEYDLPEGDDDTINPEVMCGMYIDDGYFGTPNAVYVESQPIWGRLSPDVVEISQGDTVELSYVILNTPCADIEVNSMFIGVYDWSNPEWLWDLFEASISMELEETSTGDQFTPHVPVNMFVTPTGDQLHYIWNSDNGPYTNWGSTHMDDLVFTPGQAEVFTFIFTATEFAPIGSEFEISLTELTWTDVTTGHDIMSYPFWDVATTVRVVD